MSRPSGAGNSVTGRCSALHCIARDALDGQSWNLHQSHNITSVVVFCALEGCKRTSHRLVHLFVIGTLMTLTAGPARRGTSPVEGGGEGKRCVDSRVIDGVHMVWCGAWGTHTLRYHPASRPGQCSAGLCGAARRWAVAVAVSAGDGTDKEILDAFDNARGS